MQDKQDEQLLLIEIPLVKSPISLTSQRHPRPVLPLASPKQRRGRQRRDLSGMPQLPHPSATISQQKTALQLRLPQKCCATMLSLEVSTRTTQSRSSSKRKPKSRLLQLLRMEGVILVLLSRLATRRVPAIKLTQVTCPTCTKTQPCDQASIYLQLGINTTYYLDSRWIRVQSIQII